MDDRAEAPTPISDPAKVRDFLGAAYPDLFGEERKPLKIGIHRDLLALHGDKFSGRALSRCLHWWTNGISYLFACTVPGAVRTGLDGTASGPVSEESAAWARGVVEERAAAKSRKAAARHGALPAADMARALDLIAKYAGAGPLVGDDLDFALGLLQRHPERAAKIGAGVAAIVVDKRYPALAVVRVDGTADTFSVKRCVAAPKKGALRAAA